MAHNKPVNIVIKKSPGAPSGLRWHWFRWCFLNSKLKNYYELIYDYTGDGYVLVRSRHRDDFTKKIGISRRYDWEIFFRDQNEQTMLSLYVYGVLMGEVKYFTAQSPEKLLRKMAKIAKIVLCLTKYPGNSLLFVKV